MQLINSRIKLRHDTLANWASNNIVLLDGELAIVDCGELTKFKVGNGLSTFNLLPFTDLEVLSTKWVTANAISQGIHSQSVPYGLAAGAFLCANANFSLVFGYNTESLSSDLYSFTWNGDSSAAIGNRYLSHGQGTFSINPEGGVSGIYIGEESLDEILKKPLFHSINNVTYLKPASEHPLNLSVMIYDSPEMVSCLGTFDSGASDCSSFIEALLINTIEPTAAESDGTNETSVNTQWLHPDGDVFGYGPEYNNAPAVVHLFDWLSSTSAVSSLIETFGKSTRLYLKNVWYFVTSSNGTTKFHPSDCYSQVVPSNAEVAAHSLVNQSELTTLQAVSVDYLSVSNWSDDDGFYLLRSDLVNVLANGLSTGSFYRLYLDNYSTGLEYKVKFRADATLSVGNSTIDGSTVNIVGNGEYLDAFEEDGTTFLSGKTYLVSIQAGMILKLAETPPFESGTNVQVSALLDSGTKIATISVDGVETSLYAPESSGDAGRYALVEADLSSIGGSLCCFIEDHTITTIEISSSSTPVVIYLPEKVDGHVRDFIIRVEISSLTAPGFTFVGLDELMVFDSEDDDWAVLEPGLNLISFTETR